MEKEMNVEEEIKALEEKEKAIHIRVALTDIFHEDIVIINRHDMDTISFLDMDERNREGRRRSSWYGDVIAISNIDCGDEIRENKKKKLNVGDVILYNPESAYSLNLAKFPEVWCVHVDSILLIDHGYNYMEQKKENLKKKYEIVESMKARNRMNNMTAGVNPTVTRILTK